MRHAVLLSITMVMFIIGVSSAAPAASKYQYKILHTFTGGKDGGLVGASLVLDGSGNLYGTTNSGGTENGCPYNGGCGVIFKLSPQENGRWKESILFDYVKNTGGDTYLQPLLFDGKGNLFGSTSALVPGGPAYMFELTPESQGWWNFNPIYEGGACLVFDKAGNFYGCIPPGGIGELSPGSNGWTYKDLTDQNTSWAPLSWDGHGNLYGIDPYGGNEPPKCPWSGGCGTAFQLTPKGDGTWVYHVLHNFAAFKGDGLRPFGGLVEDAVGNAYGVTSAGGEHNCGTVFKLSPSSGGHWKQTVLYQLGAFKGAACAPLYSLVFDSAGSLYGMAQGGDQKCGPCGLIFKLSPQKNGEWKYSVLHTFHGPEGADPYGVIVDGKGNIFGTTMHGGKYNLGVAFEITP